MAGSSRSTEPPACSAAARQPPRQRVQSSQPAQLAGTAVRQRATLRAELLEQGVPEALFAGD